MLGRLFDTGLRRSPQGWLGKAIKAFGALTSVWDFCAAAYSRQDALTLTVTFLVLMLALTFLLIGSSPLSDRSRIHRVGLFLAAAVSCGIIFVSSADMIARHITLFDPLSTADLAFASVLLAITLEAMRRTVGMGLTPIVLMFPACNLWGDRLQGTLGHGKIGYRHFVDITVFTTDGLFIIPLAVISRALLDGSTPTYSAP